MRAVVQRVTSARVTVADRVVGEIGRGLLVLLGIAGSDGRTDVEYLARKLLGLRVFDDPAGKMNFSVAGRCWSCRSSRCAAIRGVAGDRPTTPRHHPRSPGRSTRR